MPILKKGVDGLLTKDKHSVVYKMMHGLEWKRKKPTKLKTAPQLAQQLRFSVANAFDKQVRAMVNIGYTKRKPGLSQQNMFTSHLLKHAIVGEYPDYWIDYSKVKLSNGGLRRISVTEFVFATPGLLTLTWDIDGIGFSYAGNDLINVLLYCESQHVFLPFIRVASFSEAAVEIKLPRLLHGETLICWAFLLSENGRNSGKTFYMGELKGK